MSFIKRLSIEKIKDLMEAFQLFDLDRNGSITAEEITSVFESFGQPKDESKIEEMIKQVDKNGNGCIEFDEFVEFMEHNIDFSRDEEHFKSLFDLIDHDGNGRLTKEKIRNCFKSYGQDFNDLELDDLFEKVDQDKDGEIDFYEFMQILSS